MVYIGTLGSVNSLLMVSSPSYINENKSMHEGISYI